MLTPAEHGQVDFLYLRLHSLRQTIKDLHTHVNLYGAVVGKVFLRSILAHNDARLFLAQQELQFLKMHTDSLDVHLYLENIEKALALAVGMLQREEFNTTGEKLDNA